MNKLHINCTHYARFWSLVLTETTCVSANLWLQREVPFLPVFSSMKRLIRYSLGSVALGSLIISPVESIRFILEAARRKLKGISINPDGFFGKVGYHTTRFCLISVEWTLKSVNRNAYIMVLLLSFMCGKERFYFFIFDNVFWLVLQIAITGKSFCRASSIATELIISNILRIGKVNVIGDIILSLGKLCISLASALFAFLMLDAHKFRSAHNKISSPLFPVLVCSCATL